MEALIIHLFSTIAQGGAVAIYAILTLWVIYLILERKEMRKELSSLREAHDKNIMEVINKYHQGQISLIEAFNELKTILIVIKEKG
jgi:hypothetical protein